MDSPKASGSIRPAMGDSPPVQDSPFSLFASSLSPIPLNPVKGSSFVTFPSPEPVFASPQVHQPRKLHQLKRSEHQLFLCSSSKEPNPTTGSSQMKMTKMPLENKSQDQPCSSSSLSIDTFLVDQSETTSKNPTNSADIQNADSGKPQEIQILKIENTDHAQNEIQEINSNLNGKNIVSPTVTPKPSGIGLHLNSLAGIFTPLTSGPQESKPVHSVQNFEENQSLVNNNNNDINSPLLGKMLDPFLTPNVGKISSLLLEDSSKPNEEINKQNSPKKKRKRSGDDGHKSCNCKRSKCLKLYCECFGNGLFCNETCACQDCSNKLEDEETVKETRKQIETRNPLAFAPKVVLRLTPPTEENKDATPPSTRHKRGCNCKKSRCLKKYCECFQSGVACFAGCRCENCLNTFGSKDGAGEMIEVEQHKKPLELDTGTGTSIGTDSSEKRSKFRTMELNNVPRIPPLTPSLQTSMSHMPSIVPLHFQSSPVSPASPTSTTNNNNNNSYYPYEDLYNQISQKDETNLFSPPQFTTSSSSHPFPSTPLPQLEGRKREREGAALQESSDYSPDILEQFHMRMGVVKSTSPKKKRVELPHEMPQNSPGLRSGRKFILKSVPSLPSLSPYSNHNADNNNHNAP